MDVCNNQYFYRNHQKRSCLLSFTVKPVICFLVLAVVMFTSCNERKRSGHTTAFQLVIDSTAKIIRIHSAQQGRQAVAYMDSCYASMRSQLTLTDLNNYYSYKFIINNRDILNQNEALAYADSMILLHLNNKDREQDFEERYIQALYAKGDAYFGKGNYAQAYDYYYKAKSQGKRRMTNCDLGDYNLRVGMVYFRQGRYADAAGYFKQCFIQKASCEQNFITFYRRQEMLNNAGLSYDYAHMEDSALACFRQALGFIYLNTDNYPKENKDMTEVATAVIYGNIANVHIKRGEYLVADSLLKKSIAINRTRFGDLHDAEFSYLKLANIYNATGETAKMREMLSTVKPLLDSIPNTDASLDWNRDMSQYYEKMGMPDSALSYMKVYIAMNDSQQRDVSRISEMDLTEKVKNQEHENQIQVLRRQNDSKSFYLAVVTVIICMAGAIAWMVYKSVQKREQHVRTLTSLNNKIRDQKNQLKTALTLLEQHNKEKDRILRVVAHDLRTPIAGISVLAEIMADDKSLNDDQKENLSLIQGACESSLSLTKEILQVNNEIPPESWSKEKTDLKAVLSNQIEQVRIRAREKQQHIIGDLPDHPVYAEINPEKLGRAISNVLINSIKFSPQNAKIRVSMQEEGCNIVLHIKDEGIGIPEVIKEKVFDIFTEAKRYGTQGEKPFGLGLSITRQIIEAHGGKIWFESTEGVGTNFHLLIPGKVLEAVA